nr:non-structural polyprotein [Flumine dicistrovirus 55]
MKQLVMDNRDQLKLGIRPEIIFMDFLKDETRPLQKVVEGKTRLISSEPVNLTILIRMYFGSFMMHCYANKIFNGVAIGLNTYSYDWTILAKYLQQVGDDVVAGDHGGYDGRYRAAIYKACLEIVERFYYNSTPEDRTIRAGIIEILLSSVHCANVFSPDDGKTHAVLYEWFGALPSGTTLTALFGSIGGLIINRYAVYSICLEHEGRSHISFDNNDEIDFISIEKSIRMVQGGDDNLISLGKYLLDRGVDQNSLTRLFDEMGWEYTDETKQGLTHGTRPLSKCQFYKRWFVYDARIGRYKSPLEFDSIDDRNNWISSKAAPGDYERNVRSAILEYSQHTTQVWIERALPLIVAAKKYLNMYDLPEDQNEAFRELSKLESYLA